MTPDPRNSASQKAGLPPGSLVHVGDRLADQTAINVINYTPQEIVEASPPSIEEALAFYGSDSITWIIIEGLANIDVMESIGAHFNIHRLVLEDILSTHQRPKFEEYDDYLFIVLKALMAKQDSGFRVDYEQVSMLVMAHGVLVFKEKKDELLAPVQLRIRTSKGRFRSLGADFLTYSILDAIVDQNFLLMDSLDEAITEVEDALLSGEPGTDTLNTIQNLKRQVVSIRRFISPVRELVNEMLRSETALIDEKTHIYLRDVSDHAIRIVESVELHRDIISGLLDIYISSVSNKMNQVMKVLTVFATIFIPLTFLTGIYGMNFEYMPELGWHWSYPLMWVIFITLPAVSLIYFKRKNWL
jgi:magnesium transporter